MPGIDLLISRVFSQEIKKGLEPKIIKKIERELFFEHGMSIKLSIENFNEFHNIFKKFSSNGMENFEKDCLKKIIQVNKSQNNYNFKIIDPTLSDKILNFYGDPESRQILMSLMKNNLTISQTQKKSKVSKSPLYRKIENLLLDGIILESGKILKNTKRVSLYCCIFDEFRSVIGDGPPVVEGIVNAKNFKNSSTFQNGLFE